MKNIFKALMASAVVFVAACGGGGGGEGTPNGAAAVLRLYPPISEVSLPVGVSGSTGVEVRGGKGPFTITSSDASVRAALSTDNFLWVGGQQDGTSQVTIYDSSLPVQQVSISVTAKAVEMASNVGNAVNLTIGETRQVNMRGGVAPYSVSSADSSVVTASISGAAITLVAQPKGGTTKVIVTDATGKTFELSVTVAAEVVPVLAVTPGSVSGVAGSSNTVVISGGKAPYRVGSSNTTVASATVSGSSISVGLLAAGTSAVSVTDSAGTSVTFTVTVTAAAPIIPALTVSPAAQTVQESSSVAVTYLITGGTAPYTALLSPADEAKNTVTVDNAATPVSLKVTVPTAPAGTDRCIAGTADSVVAIDIYDATLAKKTVTLTIKNETTPVLPCT